MRIAILESFASIKSGGAERSMAFFADFLIIEKHNLFLICEKKEQYSFNDTAPIKVLETNISPLKKQGFIRYIFNVLNIILFIKNNNIEILITHTIHTFPILRFVSIFTKCKTIIYFKWVYNADKIGMFNKWGLNGINTLIAINDFVAQYWNRYLIDKQIDHLVADGVISSTFSRNVIRKKNLFQLLYIGRIYEGKGLHLIIESMKDLGQDIILNVVGYFDHLNTNEFYSYHKFIYELITKYELNQRVIFHGFQSNTDIYYENSDLVIIPSVVDDAQPLVLLESMSKKKIVIASKVGGIPEILNNDLTFLLFNPTVIDLKQKIQVVINLDNSEKLLIEEMLFTKFTNYYKMQNTHNSLINIIKNANNELR